AALAALALAALPGAARAAPAGVDPPAAFARPFYVGAFLGDAESRTQVIDRSMERYARQSGKRAAFVKTFHNLGEDFAATAWSGQLLRRISSAGSTPFVALDLRWRGGPERDLLDAIVAGRADLEIARMARGLASAGTVLVEPGWEMNGDWNYAWQGVANGREAGPAKYVAAFRRIVDISRREGATNVKWVFAPNVGNALTHAATGPRHWNWYGHYYPGDRYADYLALHGYNGPSVWGGAHRSFAEIFDGAGADHALSDMERRYPSKRILIGEFGSQEGRGFDKGRWITDAFNTLRAHPRVIGAVWFDMNKEADWRIASSRGSADAWRAVMRDGNIRESFGG
ncbi:MAG TPA: hypothetical protein VHG91_08185, partial [Longimicrobium sp.]|nr:hypothetical protein [Longimicrobium sp.]